MNKIEERIAKIKNDHATLLKLVRNNISTNKDIFVGEISQITEALRLDEISVKKYEAIVRAQELIASLTQEIVEAKTPEEVINIRKRLDYYIRKIRDELRKRNVAQETIDKYQEKNQNLKKDIAKYIRFLKREDNIAEIERLSDHYEQLTVEQVRMLRKALAKERSYVTRNMNPPKIQSSKTNPQKLDIEDIFSGCNGKNSLFQINPIYAVKSRDDALKARVGNWHNQYSIARTYDYKYAKFGKNLIHFVLNVPRNIYNKKAIKRMEEDFSQYYSGYDFAGFIEYQKRRNSIRRGLKCLFNRSYLFSHDHAYLYDHSKCCQWLIEYCNRHNHSDFFVVDNDACPPNNSQLPNIEIDWGQIKI